MEQDLHHNAGKNCSRKLIDLITRNLIHTLLLDKKEAKNVIRRKTVTIKAKLDCET